MDTYKIRLLFNTIKHLKAKQLYFRLYYYFIKPKLINFKANSYNLKLLKSIPSYPSYKNREFDFLNLTYNAKDIIDWNYSKHGKLWTYNLTYFDYLNQNNINKDEALNLILDFINNCNSIKDGLEPFPISLRGINWIKFLTYNNIENQKITNSLYSQYCLLYKKLEYHLLGNHLLENAFSLMFGAYYFRDEKFYTKAKYLLQQELNEQILNDGAHFELSIMYHQIMLFRLLDIINLIKHNSFKEDSNFLNFLIKKSSLMLGFLEQITFSNGEIPLVNDSATKIAPTSNELFEYAKRLNIKLSKKTLDSGLILIKKNNYELFINISDIKASYIPGHTHSDTFNFLLNINNQEVIVDTGISTYENNNIRAYERSTKAHNTVELNNSNQSEVWGAFRVANRAKIIKKEISKNKITAQHNGYFKRYKTIHQRTFEYENNYIKITDNIIGKTKKGTAYLHFAKNIKPKLNSNKLEINGTILEFSTSNIKLLNGYYSKQYNKKIDSIVAKIEFENKLITEIKL